MTDPIREARPDDLPRLRAIQTVVLAEPWPELLALGVDGPPVCLVYADSRPTAYALAVSDDAEGAAYLAELAVAEGHQGRGQGSALLSALVGRMRDRGVSQLRVTVRTVDERAQSFYEKHGFSVAEHLPDHYENCDGVLLTRDL